MAKSYHQPRKSQRRPWRKYLVLWGVLAVAVFCVGLVVGYFKNAPAPQPEHAASREVSPATREVLLYFASSDGQRLIAENRSLKECQIDEDCLRDTVQALLEGPQSGLAPVLPARAELRNVAVAGSLVSLDFSQPLIDAHPGGTQSELLTVFGLADTLAVNFPHLRQVQILVEGAPVATLKGHVDLRQPVSPDFSLVEEGLAPAGNMTNLPAGRDE